VYVEKPFTQTRAEAERLFALASERGLRICAGHQYLFERPFRLALKALPVIGRLAHAESYFSFRQVRRTISPVEQAKDILPHAVYPLLAQMRAGTGLADTPFRIAGLDARSEGDVYALITLGQCTGVLIVTLSGRPVEQYQHLVGTNGWMRTDYITGSVTCLPGPGSGLGVLFTPYRRALQTFTGATAGIARLLLRRTGSYPGLITATAEFYASIRGTIPPPLNRRSIVDTVAACETINQALEHAEHESEQRAEAEITRRATQSPEPSAGTVMVTGGTGLLGRKVVEELRSAGFAVRAVSRRIPRWSTRVPGVEYLAADLGAGLPASSLSGVDLVVHCAAETAGGKAEHQRNSIDATRRILEEAAAARVRSVVHVSSLAVLKPGRGSQGLDEQSPVDAGNLGRGPYVWGKAESELLAQKLARELGLTVKTIRPGPLVDYDAFHPPGRLGREIGPLFVAIGSRKSRLSVCDVGTAARVIRYYAENFDEAPALLNLVEAPPPLRRDLALRLAKERPDLRFLWFPALLLRLLSGPLKLMQRILLGSAKPIDVYAAFASERYRTDLAQDVIARAAPTAVGSMPRHEHVSAR
jgi:nucleoside-diphosphate-sugar epimerase/predicted dehydrogenase